MAQVGSGTEPPLSSWVGMPTMSGTTQRRSDEAAAFGIGPDELERRRQQTGVSAGGAGYTSGQVPPSGQAMAALGIAPATSGTSRGVDPNATPGAAPPAAPASNPVQGAAGALAQNAQVARGGTMPTSGPIGPNRAASGAPRPVGGEFVGSAVTPQPVPGAGSRGDTTTVSSALMAPGTAPAASAPAGVRRGEMPAVTADTTTRTGAISTPGGTPPSGAARGPTGTTQGQRPIPVGGDASPTVNALNRVSPGLGDSLDPGSSLVDQYLRPTLTDTTPGAATQQAGFGLSDDLSRERFDYRPGAAASQDVVGLDKAQADQIRAKQEEALAGLRAAATGAVPSAAEIQMRQEAGRNVAATLGQARALGGRSAGGAARAGTLATADLLARNNVEGAALRAAEQDRARQAEIAALGGVRGQDVDTASREAQLRQEAYQNNLRAQLDQNELAERHRQTLLQAQLQALGIGGQAAAAIMNAGSANAAAQNKFQGGVLGALGSAFGM